MYSYVVREDNRFSPNPYWGFCSLACCKPVIRRCAQVGDWIVGLGGVKNVGHGKIIYAMEVTEKITFDQYSTEKRFKKKIPADEPIKIRGDNIYYRNQKREWVQRKALHTAEHMKADLSCENVLISNNFCYWGKKAIQTPQKFKDIIIAGRGHKSRFDDDFIRFLVDWLVRNFNNSNIDNTNSNNHKSC